MAARKNRAGSRAKGTRRKAGARAVPAAEAPKLSSALRSVSSVLSRIDRKHAVIGGVAVIAWGFPRTTADIDCAIAAPLEEVSLIANAFLRAGFSTRIEDAIHFAQVNHVLLLTDTSSGVDLDVSFSQGGFELEALSRAVIRDFSGVTIRVPRVTDLLIYKLIAGRERDLRDVSELLSLGHEVDAVRIEEVLSEIDTVLETDRLGDWRRLQRSNR